MSSSGDYRISLQETDDYRRGWRAFEAGTARRDCPRPFNTKEHVAWQMGWDDAELDRIAP